MRIIDVRAVHPKTPDAPPDWRRWLGQILVAVDTDEGLTGYGVGGGGAAGVHVVTTVLRETLLGKDASKVEQLWKRMYHETLPFGRKGLAIMAISGVDLALWDLRGKREGKPVVELLGGSVDQPIPVYKTVDNVDDAKMAKRQGYCGIKLHVGKAESKYAQDRIIEQTRQLRDIVGPKMQLMIDAFMNWDVASTLRIAREITQYDIKWIEEPLPPDDLQGYAQLRRECPIPIAAGEHEYTAAAFRELMQRRLYDVYQPDVCWCGGLTQLIEIYRISQQYNLQVCPHRGAEVWGLHAIAALDPQPLAESGRPWMTWIKGRPRVKNGKAWLGDGAGFGVTFEGFYFS